MSSVEIEIEPEDKDPFRIPAEYGIKRRDTTSVCGDNNNGFVPDRRFKNLLENLLESGQHTVRALADGVEFDSATFTVTTDSRSR